MRESFNKMHNTASIGGIRASITDKRLKQYVWFYYNLNFIKDFERELWQNSHYLEVCEGEASKREKSFDAEKFDI